MTDYDPDVAPQPDEWLAEDEAVRLVSVQDYHRAMQIDLPSVPAHAGFHVAIENQIAEGLDSAQDAMSRLLGEGLGRHDAIHAIASVLSRHTYHIIKEKRDFDRAAYDRDLESLTADSCLASAERRPKRAKIVVRRRGR